MKKAIVFILFIILLSICVNAIAVYRLYAYKDGILQPVVSTETGRNFIFQIEDIYSDTSNGFFYFISGNNIVRGYEKAGALVSSKLPMNGFPDKLIPEHIDKIEGKIYVYGRNIAGPTIAYFVPNEIYFPDSYWVGLNVQNGRVNSIIPSIKDKWPLYMQVAYKPNGFIEYYIYKKMSVGSFTLLQGWPSSEAYYDAGLTLYSSQNYHYFSMIGSAGNLCLNRFGIIWGSGTGWMGAEYDPIPSTRAASDLVAISINSTTDRLWFIDLCGTGLYTIDVYRVKSASGAGTIFKTSSLALIDPAIKSTDILDYDDITKKLVVTRTLVMYEQEWNLISTLDLNDKNIGDFSPVVPYDTIFSFNIGQYGKFTALEAKNDEIYAGVTFTCVDDDDDGYTKTPIGFLAERICGYLDCDDTMSDVYPGAVEECDGKDNDCDGVKDEGCKCVVGDPNQPCDLDGVCAGTEKVCLSTGWTNCQDTYKLIENYELIETKCDDDKDNDCDTLTDCDTPNYDPDCMQASLCSCTRATEATECGTGYVCEDNKCIPKCTKDANCAPGESCNIADGHCIILPLVLTRCSDVEDYCDDKDLSPEDCIKICNGVDTDDENTLPFDCYWDPQFLGEDCKLITETTTCSDLSSSQELCELTLHLACSWNDEDGTCEDKEVKVLPKLGCTENQYPQLGGTCDDGVDPNADDTTNCDEYGTCDSGEVCGCSDCTEQPGAGGCQMDYWCSESGACVSVDLEPDIECGELGYDEIPYAECLAQVPPAPYCINDYWSLPSGAILDVNGVECCFGYCWDGTFETISATGEQIILLNKGCIPSETDPSKGTRIVNKLENGQETLYRTEECTIIPSRRVPFSSALGILIGLVIIIMFYLLRKKH